MAEQQYCAPCLKRGHQCLTTNMVDDVPTCVFCEDGEPCPVDKAKVAVSAADRLPCSRNGCEGTYRKGAKHPFCSACQQTGYHKSAGSTATAKKPARSDKSKAAPTPAVSAVKVPAIERAEDSPLGRIDEPTVDLAAIRVPVHFLDDFWQERSTEEKAAMVSFHFAQEAGITTRA